MFESARCGSEIVEGVARYPHHGGGGHHEADVMGPLGVLHVTVLDGFPLDAVEEEDGGHDGWCDPTPAKCPVLVWHHSFPLQEH